MIRVYEIHLEDPAGQHLRLGEVCAESFAHAERKAREGYWLPGARGPAKRLEQSGRQVVAHPFDDRRTAL